MTLQLLFDALSLGGIYAIAALGIALIFGVMKLVNFAHGQFIACAVFALIVPSADAIATLGVGALPAPLLIPVVLALGRAWPSRPKPSSFARCAMPRPCR